jgi:hypothetical protein
MVVELELPADYDNYRLPKTFDRRLHTLLERQNVKGKLSPAERKEADELTRIAELLSLVRLRAERTAKSSKSSAKSSPKPRAKK